MTKGEEEELREKVLEGMLVALRSDNEHTLAVALREVITAACGKFDRAQGIACLYMAYQQFAEAGGSRETWLAICARVFDETITIRSYPEEKPR